MIPLKESLTKASDTLRDLTNLGVTIIMAFVVIDVLFPGTTGVVQNLGTIVEQFSKEGLTGLIALLLFLILFKNK